LFAEDGALTSRSTRQADALVALAQKSVAEDPDPDRATVVLNVDLDHLMTGTGGADESSGGVFSSTVMQRIACDARIQAIIRNARGDAVGVGTVLRTAPPGIRRILMRRDGGCRFPGCTNKCFLDAHHIVEWTKGGRTELQNLALLCRAHHRMLHKSGWSLRGDPNGRLEVIDDKGRPVRAGPMGLEEDVRSWLWDEVLQGSVGSSAERKRVGVLN
ncbi:MAG: HNH endonuclease, partial [Actinobacteria bacterium]|nr:HNH endonuclease [Actinomycetota bacterium]